MFSSWCLKAIHLSRVLLLFADHCLNILFIKVNILPFKNVRVTKIRKMAQTVRAAGIFNGHKVSHSNRGLTRLPQSGAGLGDLLRGFIRWIIPAGKTLIKEGADVKAGLRSNATKVIDGLSQSVSSSLKDYRPPAKKKKKKRGKKPRDNLD